MNFVSSLTEMSIFRVLNLVQLQLRSASEWQSFWINSAGLNDLGRPRFELGSAHEKVRRLNRALHNK